MSWGAVMTAMSFISVPHGVHFSRSTSTRSPPAFCRLGRYASESHPTVASLERARCGRMVPAGLRPILPEGLRLEPDVHPCGDEAFRLFADAALPEGKALFFTTVPARGESNRRVPAAELRIEDHVPRGRIDSLPAVPGGWEIQDRLRYPSVEGSELHPFGSPRRVVMG